MRLHEDGLYNDYFVGNKSNPTISVSAIVGENGAGKSSVIEYYIRLINNFAAATIGEYEVNPGAQHLHFIVQHCTKSCNYICIFCHIPEFALSYLKIGFFKCIM